MLGHMVSVFNFIRNFQIVPHSEAHLTFPPAENKRDPVHLTSNLGPFWSDCSVTRCRGCRGG